MSDRRLALLMLLPVVLVDSTARGAAPTGRYIVSSETVHDTRTQLIWQRGALPMTYDHDGANAYCSSLALGSGVWRLPTIKELATLLDLTQPASPKADSTAFAFTQLTSFYWSSSHYAGPGGAWGVRFDTGQLVTNDWQFTGGSVRCVR
jgi:hypothetical protein